MICTETTMRNRNEYNAQNPFFSSIAAISGAVMKTLTLLVVLSIIVLMVVGCGSGSGTSSDDDPDANGDSTVDAPPDAGPTFIIGTEVDLDNLFSRGLPVILNFGDDSPASMDTLAALEAIHAELGEHILIYSVDLAREPTARQGFPVQVIPSQFFYLDDGTPIPLPVNIEIIMSTFLSTETEEPVFTIHEGPLHAEGFLVILENMGVVSIVRL